MSNVFVLDTNKRSLNPVHPGRARKLLSAGQAAIFRRFPFTIILKKAVAESVVQPLRLKLDPGSKTTGIAIVNDASGDIVFAAELEHRGHQIKAAMDNRRALRQGRRHRHTRYRKPRHDNRRRHAGWLPPSLESRLANILTWTRRLMRLCPIVAISQEVVKFDLQQMEHPEIEGVEYQQGTLAGYELREYLLEKWGRQCVYCAAKNVPLQVEHIHCRAHGGSDRESNLTLACASCNHKKGTQDIKVFLEKRPDILTSILVQVKAPRKDAAAVNITRQELFKRLQTLELPIECGSGGLTKYNRVSRGLEKLHWLDAACVGTSTPQVLHINCVSPLDITATGSGNRQMCGTDRVGFPIRHRVRQKHAYGFQTGDIVQAIVPHGKKTGIHTGRVLIRARGSFDISTKQGRIQGISHRYCTVLHHCDGYTYRKGTCYSFLA